MCIYIRNIYIYMNFMYIYMQRGRESWTSILHEEVVKNLFHTNQNQMFPFFPKPYLVKILAAPTSTLDKQMPAASCQVGLQSMQ